MKSIIFTLSLLLSAQANAEFSFKAYSESVERYPAAYQPVAARSLILGYQFLLEQTDDPTLIGWYKREIRILEERYLIGNGEVPIESESADSS